MKEVLYTKEQWEIKERYVKENPNCLVLYNGE